MNENREHMGKKGYLKLQLHKAPHYVRKIEFAIEQFFFQNFFNCVIA
jgi:hypothetical protein